MLCYEICVSLTKVRARQRDRERLDRYIERINVGGSQVRTRGRHICR